MTTLRAARHTESLVERDRQRRQRWRNVGLVSIAELSNLLKPERAPIIHYNVMQTAGKPKLHLVTKNKILEMEKKNIHETGHSLVILAECVFFVMSFFLRKKSSKHRVVTENNQQITVCETLALQECCLVHMIPEPLIMFLGYSSHEPQSK